MQHSKGMEKLVKGRPLALGGGGEWSSEVSAILAVIQWHSSSPLPEEPVRGTGYFDSQISSALCHPNGANCEDVSWPLPLPDNSFHRVLSLSRASTVPIKVE